MCVCVDVCVPVFTCVCVCVCAVMLPSLVLHRSSVRPYQRGFYCSDSSLGYSFKSSTVPSSVLTAVGLTLPSVSVSQPPFGAPGLGNRSVWGGGGGGGWRLAHGGVCGGSCRSWGR